MNEDGEILQQILRDQAWQRAKGEMRAMLATYYRDQDMYSSVAAKVDAFIGDLDDNELG